MVPETRIVGDIVIIDLKGRVTHGSGDLEMRETIQQLLEEGKRKGEQGEATHRAYLT